MLLVDLRVSVVIWSFIGACIARSRRFQLIKVLRAHYPRPPLVLQVLQLEMETVAVALLVQMVSKTGPPHASANVINEIASSRSCGLTQSLIRDGSDSRRLSVRLLNLSAIG